MFSKDLNDVLIGSDTGYVECFNVQKHKPSDRIIFIKLEHGHFLVCQKNHPLFIKREDTLIEIDASELDVCTDEIWVDNDITKNEFNLQLCEDKDILNLTTKLFVSGNLDEIYNINDEFKDIIFGDSYKNIRLFPNFINCDRTQLTKFIDIFGNICKVLKDYCKSYILASQIKMICDRINYDCDVTPYEKHKTTYYKFDIKPNLTEELYFNKYCKINEIYELIYYDDFVYDVKTCNNAYMLNCIKNHNSFHSGGSASIKKVDIIKELKRNISSHDESRIENIFYQKDSDIYLKNDSCIITIDKNVFLNAESKIELTQNEIKLEVGYFTINVDNFIIEATIEQDAILAIHDRQNFVENENTIAINYFKNEKLFGIKSKIIEPEDVATMLDAFAGGKSPFKTPENLYTKLYNFLAPMRNWDSVHLELIVGNLLRNKKDPQYPARVKEPYEYVTLSVKTLPMVQSWSLGLAFEDIGKAISYGLISDRQPASSIEKVLFGEPLSDIAIKKLKEKK